MNYVDNSKAEMHRLIYILEMENEMLRNQIRKLKIEKIEDEKISKLLKVIVSVKGEKKEFTKSINDTTKISIEDIQKTLNKYGHGHIKVKAEIKK